MRIRRLVATLLLTALPLAGAHAATLNGDLVTVTLLETPYDPATEDVTANPPLPHQITGGSATEIGSLLFSSEYIDIHDLQVVYRIQGGTDGYAGSNLGCAGSPGCSIWGLVSDDARLVFSDLDFGADTTLTGVTLLATNVFDAFISDITAHSFVLNFGSAGILNGSGGVPDLGTLTMNLQVVTAPVPLPAALPFLLSGCLGLGLLRRKRTCAGANS